MTLEQIQEAASRLQAKLKNRKQRARFFTEAHKNPDRRLTMMYYDNGGWTQFDLPEAAVAPCLAIIEAEHNRELKTIEAEVAAFEAQIK